MEAPPVQGAGLDVAPRPKRSWRLIKVAVLVGGVMFLSCAGVVGVPVVRISTAVPGTNPGSVEQVHELIDRYQPEGADPAAGNAHDILGEVCERSAAITEDVNGRFLAEVEGDPVLAEFLTARRAKVDITAIESDALKLVPGDWGYEHAEAMNAVHRRYALEWVRLYRESGLPERVDDIVETKYARRTQPPGMLIHTLLPELGTSRKLGRANAAAMRQDLEGGDGVGAVRWFERSLAIARAIGHQPSPIERLVAGAIMVEALRPVREFAVGGRLDPATLRGMLDAMGRHLPLPTDEIAFEGERLCLLDAIERTYSDDGSGSGCLLFLEFNRLSDETVRQSPSVLNTPGLFLPRKREVVGFTNEFFDEIVSVLRVPRQERDYTKIKEYEALLDSKYRLTPVPVLMASLGNATRAMDGGRTHEGGAALVLAIELYRAEHGGRVPADLQSLVPAYLAELPVDPFADDGAFRYVASDDGEGYLLYSVGFDQADDGGRYEEADPEAALTHEDKKYDNIDYVFNRPAAEPAGD